MEMGGSLKWKSGRKKFSVVAEVKSATQVGFLPKELDFGVEENICSGDICSRSKEH